jgi:hypothetical protein
MAKWSPIEIVRIRIHHRLQNHDPNHAFQRCTTGMQDGYETIDHVMADEVINEVSAWIHSTWPPV